ncbi:MAG: FAD-dependent oxidoreductase [Gammaproteobacteria bacterium]|jgi:glycerol-3-phosphate dehydrogenase|nr:FAD-dependent oxidoreductase [Gammaproteobacteria bacterium]MBT4377822.1 FAD-dependent oxidoreductase [Gammaproteobacteria bacterium]MBT5443236.1 FAD-dependent oxidoreductase [Gammaproteobacteria bacterium]MBT5790107.1 FAD-dependent oxidoreductase [Gammaproteobacteria bacterium]MBT6948679.1 FAD-dependent oxidoreductase [Gammaproteobacteria bacterium]
MSNTTHQFDTVILGGGIAGLWLLSLLRKQGFEAILLEKKGLGSEQTLASQGMIHGGIKYSLAGAMTGASESIADMPLRWRSCLEGTDSVNLEGVSVLSEAYYMFSDARLSSKLTAFFGSKAIEGRVSSVPTADYPEIFQSPSFGGLLYKLNDLVLDTRSLITHLHHQLKDYIFEGNVSFEHTNGRITHLQLDDGLTVSAETYVLAAGKGNGELIEDLGLEVPMQLRPLHQVVVKGRALPDLFAHAVTLRSADKPRITFTTHSTADTKAWYLGGQLAESGVARNEAEQIEFAKTELAAIMPWIDYSGCEFSTFRIDRAEAGGETLLRPDTPYVRRHGNVVVCWPTKLTLAPMMGDMFMKLMAGPKAGLAKPPNLPRASIGSSPWE